MLSISILKEDKIIEKRVSLIPKDLFFLKNIGINNIFFERNCGLLSGFSDNNYIDNGAILLKSKKIIYKDIILSINLPCFEKFKYFEKNSILICLNLLFLEKRYLNFIKKNKISILVLNKIPRISRAQSMDFLTSISYISGYRIFVESIYHYDGFVGGYFFSNIKINPLKIFIIGAGISGLSAISLFLSFKSKVYVYDINLSVKRYVESLGAKYIDIKNSLYLFLLENINKFDIIIISVNCKNNFSFLIDKNILNKINKRIVIIDFFSKYGGNCELSSLNKVIKYNNIKIISYDDFSNLSPYTTSLLYSNNLVNFLKLILNKRKKIFLNFNDFIIKSTIFFYKGLTEDNYKKKYFNDFNYSFKKNNFNKINKNNDFFLLFLFLFFLNSINILYNNYIIIFLSNFFTFILFSIISYKKILNISYSFHTPLMSLTNAISGMISIGFLLQSNTNGFLGNFFSFLSFFLLNINIFTGFFITRRMLKILFNK